MCLLDLCQPDLEVEKSRRRGVVRDIMFSEQQKELRKPQNAQGWLPCPARRHAL
jgi:hypothetical protein